ncbi:MAG: hypothetical protein RBS41_10310, partial [Desulfobacter postgatei]|nr:hypothetical protein [Desulfobacter postgatei]
GDLKMTLIGHGSLMFEHGEKIIHVDPWTKVGDYASLPKADLVPSAHRTVRTGPYTAPHVTFIH